MVSKELTKMEVEARMAEWRRTLPPSDPDYKKQTMWDVTNDLCLIVGGGGALTMEFLFVQLIEDSKDETVEEICRTRYHISNCQQTAPALYQEIGVTSEYELVPLSGLCLGPLGIAALIAGGVGLVKTYRRYKRKLKGED